VLLCCGGYRDRSIGRSRFGFEHTQHCHLPRPLQMIHQVVDASRQTICFDLHRRQLGAQCRQAFAQRLTQMFEASCLEMRLRR